MYLVVHPLWPRDFPHASPLGLRKSLGRRGCPTQYIPPLGSVKSIKYPRHKIKFTHLPSSLWATGSEEAGFRRNINGKRISWRRRSKSCVIVLLFYSNAGKNRRMFTAGLRTGDRKPSVSHVMHTAKKPHPGCICPKTTPRKHTSKNHTQDIYGK